MRLHKTKERKLKGTSVSHQSRSLSPAASISGAAKCSWRWKLFTRPLASFSFRSAPATCSHIVCSTPVLFRDLVGSGLACVRSRVVCWSIISSAGCTFVEGNVHTYWIKCAATITSQPATEVVSLGTHNSVFTITASRCLKLGMSASRVWYFQAFVVKWNDVWCSGSCSRALVWIGRQNLWTSLRVCVYLSRADCCRAVAPVDGHLIRRLALALWSRTTVSLWAMCVTFAP